MTSLLNREKVYVQSPGRPLDIALPHGVGHQSLAIQIFVNHHKEAFEPWSNLKDAEIYVNKTLQMSRDM